MPVRARIYIALVIAAGLGILATAAGEVKLPRTVPILIYLACSAAAGLLKVRLPGIAGTYSLAFLPTLVGIAYLDLPTTLMGAALSSVAQTILRTQRRPTVAQLALNTGNLFISIAAATACCAAVLRFFGASLHATALILAIAVYFALNTFIVSGVLHLLEGRPLSSVCEAWYLWNYPWYLLGGAVAVVVASKRPEMLVILLPLAFLVHFYCTIGGRIEQAVVVGNNALSDGAATFANTVTLTAISVFSFASIHSFGNDIRRTCAYLVMGILTAMWKVRLPGMVGTISVSFVFLLVTILQLEFGPVLLIAAVIGIIQTVWRPKQAVLAIQVAFNAGSLVLSSAVAFLLSRNVMPSLGGDSAVAQVCVATITLYGVSSALGATMMSHVAGEPMPDVWRRCFYWTFSYYLVGGVAAGLILATAQSAGWFASFAVFPAMALVYVSYRAHLMRATDVKLNAG